MNYIYIEHNPFLVETVFRINEDVPSESSIIRNYQHKRLQLWVERIFFDLKEIFNGNDSFCLDFKGVASDFMDFKEAALKAEQAGMSIELSWIEVDPTESRLDKVKALMTKAQSNPKFARYIEEGGEDVRQDFEAAFNNDFDVYVIATMSSGKSTFINAMLGQDLLPAANEATTATIAQIYDDKSRGIDFSGQQISADGGVIDSSDAVTLELLREWNRDATTKAIKLHGDIRAVVPSDNVRLVLTDTPGPNNSQDEEHERTTIGFIQDSRRNPLIVYVLNATQLGTNDDRNLLRLVAEIMSKGGKQSKDRFIFVVNKMDMFDPEQGEDVEAAIGRVRGYLRENGIPDPNIYPVSALLARLLRKQGELTRKERGDKNTMEELFLEEPSMDLPAYMSLSSKVVQAMMEKAPSEAIKRSGLPAVEAVIDEYISKYSFPMRLNRAHLALSSAIERGMQEAELIRQLETGEQELNQLLLEIESLQKRRDHGFNTQAYKEKVKHEGHDLPENVQKKLNKTEMEVYAKIRTLGDAFTGEASIRSAEQRLDVAASEIEFAFKKTINDYEEAFQSSQGIIKAQLHEEYQQHIASLFPDSKALELPIFKSLKKSISAISLDIDLKSEDVREREVISGYRTVSASKWYNPFSWGRTREVAIYSNEEYVDLQNIWKERVTVIRSEFGKLKTSAITHIAADKDKLVDNYLNFIEKEFKSKFDALLEDLNAKVANRDEREQAIAQAKREQAEIAKLKKELESILRL